MKLVGDRVALIPVPHALSVAVVGGAGLVDAVARAGLTAAPGWPHADTADALRPLAEHGGPGPAHGTFLITVDGELLGECGWLGGPDDRGDVEIGYGLAGPARGRGIGTEAVGVLAAWVERQPGVSRITADALIGNAPSRRVLERLGFRADVEHPPYITYVRDAPHIAAASRSS
ncbi:MAG: [ribosomal protein S5]-alanine N-acetyltransferase [Actinomycetota bacterium]|nr:[ribosomal protein S5]-alanine N-acetyltransferase [Actinomycetota bacterium]